MKIQHEYNMSYILLVGVTIFHLILGTFYDQSPTVRDKVVLSWAVSLLIPVYIAVKTRNSVLSKGVICCILILYFFLGAKYAWNYIDYINYLPVCIAEQKKENERKINESKIREEILAREHEEWLRVASLKNKSEIEDLVWAHRSKVYERQLDLWVEHIIDENERAVKREILRKQHYPDLPERAH